MTVIRFPAIQNFHTLPKAEAEKVIKDVLLPTFKERGISLNVAGIVAEERSRIASLSIERIQRVFSRLDTIVEPAATYWRGDTPYGLRNIVEKKAGGTPLTGEVIAAILLKGYPAEVSYSNTLILNCSFKIQIIK